ncbi:MAG: Uncharacterised protein [Cellulomonadaceae bacterium TMED98]|nr:MAG: Uncharacterised protein [Cellulomonadaceae bacterium TMED98]
MGNKDNAGALARQLAHDVHEFVCLLRGQHRRWLIEHQDFGIPCKGFNDFHPLLHTDREVFDDRVGVDVEPETIGNLTNKPPCLLQVQSTKSSGGLVPENDIFGDSKDRYQHEVLVDHPNSRVHGIAWTTERHRLVIKQYLA